VYVLRLDEARRESQILALAAVIGGGDFEDPVRLFLEGLEEQPAESNHPDRELRDALGLT